MIDYEPKRVTVKELLKSDNVYKIPRYQRSYAWKNDNIDDFYEDFIKTSESNMNFFGTFVFDASDSTAYQIIDGQQRVMTLTILFAVIRDILNEDIATQSAYKLAQSIDDSYIRADDELSIDDESIYRVIAAKNVEDFFLQYIQMGGADRRRLTRNLNPSEKNIKNVYEYIRKLICVDKISSNNLTADQKITILKDTANKIGRITAIKIEIFNNEIAYSIFESHNAKGEDLLISDLVKNYYYSRLTGPEDKREARIDQWDNIVERLREQASVKIDNFLHYYMQSYDGRFLKSQLYKRVKSDIAEDALKFSAKFNAQADLFIQLKDASVSGIGDSIKINKSLERISRFNVDQVYIFLLCLFRNNEKIAPNFIKRIVVAIEKHAFLYNAMSKKQANVMEKIYGSYSLKLEHDIPQMTGDKLLATSGNFYSEFMKALKDTLPTKDEFTSLFKELDYTSPKQKRLMKDYIFPVIEEYLTNNGLTFGVDISLDHIGAKSTGGSRKRIHKIGNLVPIDASSNSKLGKKALPDKIEVYKEYRNKNIEMLLDYLERNGLDLTDDLIDKRSIELAHFAYDKVWDLERA